MYKHLYHSARWGSDPSTNFYAK